MRPRYVLISLALFLFIGGLALALYMNRETPSTCASLPAKPSVIAFGDSLVAGYGAPSGADFVSKLSSSTGIPIRNMGRNGDTSASGLARIQDVLDAKPDIVIVLLGGNDALKRTSPAETERDIAAILDALAAAGIRPILVGVIGGFPTDPYAPMFKRLAERYDAAYVPNILAGLIGNNEFMSDAIHPNSDGYTRIAARIQPPLERACSGFSKK